MVDYVVANLSFTFSITNLNVSNTLRLSDHAYLTLTLTLPLTSHPTTHTPSLCPTTLYIRFDHNLDHIYTQSLNKHLTNLHQIQDPIFQKDLFSIALWLVAIESFPHTVHTPSPCLFHGHCPHNSWFDNKCKTLHKHI